MRQRPLAVAVAALSLAPSAAIAALSVDRFEGAISPQWRARAEKALVDRFDARKFHTAVLGDGPLPLDVLEAKIDRWIASQKGSES